MSKPSKALFLFSHHDDEFGVFFLVEDFISQGLEVHIVYLTSSHIDGWAADLAYTGSRHRYELLNAVMQVFDRVGIAKTFIHVDVDANKTAGVVWMYS